MLSKAEKLIIGEVERIDDLESLLTEIHEKRIKKKWM